MDENFECPQTVTCKMRTAAWTSGRAGTVRHTNGARVLISPALHREAGIEESLAARGGARTVAHPRRVCAAGRRGNLGLVARVRWIRCLA